MTVAADPDEQQPGPVHTIGPERCIPCTGEEPVRAREIGGDAPDQPAVRRVTEAAEAAVREAAAIVPQGAAMLCLAIPPGVAAGLAVPGGEPAEELHITLMYLGRWLDERDRQAVETVAARLAATRGPLVGRVYGQSTFPAGDDGRVPVWARVDVPGLAAFRARLVDEIRGAGVWFEDRHPAYTPHMTVTYLVGDQAAPPPTPDTPVRFDALTWVYDRTWTPYPFRHNASGGAMPTSTREAVAGTLVGGRVLEAKGTDAAGGRIFRVRLIRYGESRNRRGYPEPVMRAAARLYEGAQAYDHHRDDAELRTSTIRGLVGGYRNVEAAADGLYADLHLLPSATHAAEALDASLAAQQAGLKPLIGLSHDVMATYQPRTEGARRWEEATAIVAVQSVDLVADPAAGGQATRMLAGGADAVDGHQPSDPAGAGPTEERQESMDKGQILAALGTATADELAAVGLSKATAPAAPTAPAPAGTAAGDATGGTGTGPAGAAAVPAAVGATESAQRSTEAGEPKTSFLGQLMVRHKVESAGLPIAVVESLTEALPDRITEATVDAHIATLKGALGMIERSGLTSAPVVGAVKVTKESRDKQVEALDAMFDGDYAKGYRSFREAWADISGYRPQAWGEDLNRRILRECFGAGFDSGVRSTESLTSGSWAQVLGDSITRRMIKLYNQPSLQSWRKIVSDIVPVMDFRQNRRTRVGGYGVLPVVEEGQPYQPLQSPQDEEAVYAIIKRGGTEDLTIETIANDDLGAVRNIPRLMALAAAITLYRFVWDILRTNVTCTYDSTALFHATHNNTDNPAALGHSTLRVARRKMRQQAAYGDATNILSLKPSLLVVPSELEDMAFTLTNSAVQVSATLDATVPNLHRGMDYEVIDYWTDQDDWFLVADPNMCPTIEVGFYQGRQEPELFTQADGNTGTMFNADKFTYKIRHAYHGTPLEHRGFYRGAN